MERKSLFNSPMIRVTSSINLILLGLFFVGVFVIGCNKSEEKKITHYPDGKIKSEAYFLKGKKHGVDIDYYENGKIHIETRWLTGKAHGKQVVFSEDGTKIQENLYKNNHLLLSKDFMPQGWMKEVRVYDTLGRIFDFFRYKQDGARDYSESSKDPVFILDRDTVEVGEVYSGLIRLGNRQFDIIDVFIGDISDPDIMMKSKPLQEKDSLTAIFRIKADSPGYNEFSGVIIEKSLKSDSVNVIPFTHRYFVKDKPKFVI